MNDDVTQDELKAVLKYDPETGIMVWCVQRGNAAKGDVAGTLHKGAGYWQIRFKERLYKRSRLAWLYVHGYFPENIIDHRNRIRHDDRIANLREVTHQCNLRNAGVSSNSQTGVTGVYPHSANHNIFVAGMRINNKNHHIGQSKDFVESCALRYAAEQCLDWGDCNTYSTAGAVVKEYTNSSLMSKLN